MARISGVDLPPSKQVAIGLTYIYGIGRTRALDILGKAEIEATLKVRDLSDEETQRIQRVINQEGRVEGDLRKAISLDIKRLIEIGSYRGRSTTALALGSACGGGAFVSLPTEAFMEAQCQQVTGAGVGGVGVDQFFQQDDGLVEMFA